MQDPHGVFCFLAPVPRQRRGESAAAQQLHIHSFHEFVFAASAAAGGETTQFCADRRFPVQPGDLFFMPAGRWHIARTTAAAQVFVLNF